VTGVTVCEQWLVNNGWSTSAGERLAGEDRLVNTGMI
jgi:hypothetical protein